MVFEGTAYVTPLLGAYAADSFWGRYKTILVFSLVYCFVSAPTICSVPQ
jgi:dipeptide/tripeptide permease